jgi:hypothetical protein
MRDAIGSLARVPEGVPVPVLVALSIAPPPRFDYIHQVLASGVAGSSAAASLRPSLLAVLLVLAAQPARAAERVGSETCRACHPTAFQVWKASPHAKASENLTAAQRDDLRCAYCHAPERARAVQQTGPFQRGDQGPGRDAALPGRDAALIEGGVGCESCHGAGQYYSPGYVMRDSELARAVGLLDPGQKSCLVCHSAEAPSISPFDFGAKVKLIDHWTQTRTQAHAAESRGASDAPATEARSP